MDIFPIVLSHLYVYSSASYTHANILYMKFKTFTCRVVYVLTAYKPGEILSNIVDFFVDLRISYKVP